MTKQIDLKNLSVGTAIEGVAYLGEYSEKLTKTGKLFGSFLFRQGEESVAGVMWSLQGKQIEVEAGMLVYIHAVVEQYNGVQLKVTDLSSVPEGSTINKSAFLPTVVGYEQMTKDFSQFLSEKLEGNYRQALAVILSGVATPYVPSTLTVWERLLQEFAGKAHHDACIGGLANHTYKMLKIAETLIANDPRLQEKGYAELLYLGIFVHDIGKIDEMQFGVYQPYSFVSHRVTGVMRLTRVEDQLVPLLGVEGYHQLLALINGHHGEFGDAPSTVLGQIVHLVDMLEAGVTGLLDQTPKQKNGRDTVYQGNNLYTVEKELLPK